MLLFQGEKGPKSIMERKSLFIGAIEHNIYGIIYGIIII